MRTIHIEKTGIEKDGAMTREFKAVFTYGDLERMCKHLMLDVLAERGELDGVHPADPTFNEDAEVPGLRVESRLCEPDGDMGYPGIAICLMQGPANYYPRLMERSHDKTTPSRITRMTYRRREGLWAKLKGFFS